MPEAAVKPVPLYRLYLMRAIYLLLVVGLAFQVWPLILNHSPAWPLMNSVVASLLGALGALAVLGLRYPLQMLPLLLFELTWKAIWLAAVAFPVWRANAIDERTMETLVECALGAILLIVIPWGYVFDNYVKKRGDRWW